MTDTADPKPSGLASLVDRVRNMFRSVWRTTVDETKTTRRPGAEAPRFFDTKLRPMVDVAEGQSGLLRQVVHDVARSYWDTGYADAQRGQRRAEFTAVADASAEFFRKEFLTAANAQVTELAQAEATKREVLASAQRDYQARTSHLELVSELWRRNPRWFSKPLAAVYLLVAVLLVIADVPLALKLTQQGFDLYMGEPPIDEFFKHPWLVIQNNWEVVILAAGLALCTVYIKIFYDAYAGTVLSSADKSSASAGGQHSRWWFDRAVLVLTLGTTLSLGAFRFATNQRYDDAGLHHLFTDWGIAAVTLLTFCLITLLFPVIGGICLSLGVNQWQNANARKRASHDVEAGRAVYLEASAEVESLTERLSQWTAMHEWCASSGFVQAVANLLRGTYDHGYERGWMDNFQSGDILTSAMRLRTYMTAHRLRDLVNDSDEPPPHPLEPMFSRQEPAQP